MSRSKIRRSVPRLETLETNAVPAVTSSFDSFVGKLTVRSDAGDSIVVAGVGSGPRLNGSYFLKVGEVFRDNLRDSLTSGLGSNWFLRRIGEDDSDEATGDFVTAL